MKDKQEEAQVIAQSDHTERVKSREASERAVRVEDKDLVSGGQVGAVVAILGGVGLLALGGILGYNAIKDGYMNIWAVVLVILGGLALGMVKYQGPNKASIYTFFGNYIGTYRKAGLYAVFIPFMEQKSVSLAQSNFESEKLKINDERGNPLTVSAVVVYRVARPASAVFSVDDYQEYLQVQTEGALRHVISLFPYSSPDETKKSLLRNLEDVNYALLDEIVSAVGVAGIEIVEARINNLAYSVEIAQSMLQVQQAEAVLEARKVVVEGSVGIVNEAVGQLQRTGTALTEEDRAKLISNLLVVLVGDKSAQPVVNMR